MPPSQEDVLPSPGPTDFPSALITPPSPTIGFALPHPLVLLVIGILLAALLTWIVPAGSFERHDHPATGRQVVVPGTYHRIPEAKPVGIFRALVNVPKGLMDAADVIFFVFLAGGAFAVVDKTGALRTAVDWLAHWLQDRQALVIPVICFVFALGGILENLQEEIIALVPVLLLLSRRIGFDALTAVAMSIGAAAVGSAFSPVNPFQVMIAQKVSDIPLFSGATWRILFLIPALLLWMWGTYRYAIKARRLHLETSSVQLETAADKFETRTASSLSSTIILLLVGAAFTLFVLGVVHFKWDFQEMAAIFLAMGILAGLVGGLGFSGTAECFVMGFREMTYAALLIGFARAIYVVLDDGKIVDTLVSAIFTPLEHFPVWLATFGMTVAQAIIHIPVPSVSGQAVLTLPILAPVADLLGLSRQIAVLTYQYGAGLCDLITPTNAALMAILGASGVRFESWLKFALPLWGGLMLLGLLSAELAIVFGVK